MEIAASILAGGVGHRMSASVPKQFLEILGQPVLAHTLREFLRCGRFDEIAVAIHPVWTDELNRLLARFGWAGRIRVVPGGETRQASSAAVLGAWRDRLGEDDLVVIHDAARCLVDGALIGRCIEAARAHGAATATIPSIDTVARVAGGIITDLPPRSEMHSVQTPQAFRYGWIVRAHESARARGVIDATDDARLVMEDGHPVTVVEGSPANVKVSTPQDLAVTESLLRLREGPPSDSDR